MVVADRHPSVEELAAFALGTLREETNAAVEAHVASCPSCQERAAVAPGDTFVQLLCSVHARKERLVDTVAEAAGQAQTPALLPGPCGVTLAPVETGGPEVPEAGPAELACHERYRVVRLLGAGGMGSVYEAEHRVMRRPVALKVINRAYTARPAAVERFRREVRAAARLSHPNIVATHDAEDAGDRLFLVMEFVEGTSLARLVEERGPLPVAEACEYVRQAALGLQHAHERGMVHRDVKPANLLRCPDGTVKVLDFGLAALAAERGSALTETEVVMGTPEFMAPEQAADAHSADIRADVYSLGCTLWFLLTGSAPYPAATLILKILAHRERPLPSIAEARPDMPPGLVRVLERLLAKAPEDRYQTPAEVAAALAPFADLHHPETSATIPAVADAPSRRPPLRRGAVALGALLIAGAAIGGTAVYRIQTDKGVLVITTESDDVEVVIKQGGKSVDVVDTKTDKRVSLALKSGDYELELKAPHEGLKLTLEKATLTRGKETLAKIERVEKAAPEEVGEVRRFVGHGDFVWGVALSPNGRYALSSSSDNSIRLWNLQTGIEVRSYPGHTGHTHAVAFLPDGRAFLSCSLDGTLRLWDVETAKQLHRADLGAFAYDVVVSPDGRLAMAGLGDRTAVLWDIEEWKEVRRFKGHEELIVQRVAFSADGRRALSGCWDKTMRLWDVKTGTQLKGFMPHQGYVMGVALSPDGGLALSGSGPPGGDGELILWDVATEKEVRRFEGHKGRVQGVAFSPDGHFALSGAEDGSVRLWEVATGKEIRRFDGHQAAVYSVVFSRDGRHALSGSHDRTVRLWRLPDPPAAKNKP